MANQPQNGERNVAVPDENVPAWRPQDQPVAHDDRRRDDDWRSRRYGESDPRYAESDRRGRDDDRRGSDQGYRSRGAGRYGDDRLHQLRGRPEEPLPSAGSFEDRYREIGADDRGYASRGGYWQDRSGSEFERFPRHDGRAGHDFESERRDLRRGRDERMGYPIGAYARGDERMGYPVGSYGRLYSGNEPHIHRGTGPHRGKGPACYQRSDERIRELVCEALTDDDQIDATHIEVTVDSGEVTLSGTVEDRHAKRDAEDCACSVPGVRDVQNLLRIQDERGRSNPASGAAVGTHETAAQQNRKHRA